MEADATIARLAARQRGLLTRAQAHQAGISDRQLQWRVRQGTLVLAEPGVYRVAGAPTTWHQSVLAACLAEDGWASHRTAGALWELDGCRPGVVEVLTPRWKRRPNRSVRVHETRCFDETDQDEIDGLPVTSAPRTIADLGAVLPTDRVELALGDAFTRRLVTPDSMWSCVERLDGRGRPWIAPLKRLVAGHLGTEVGVQPNRFETLVSRLLVRAGLREPEAQVEIRRPDGSLIGRVDLLYADARVIIECDGELHGNPVRRRRDYRRDRELTALGYRVLRISWEDLTQHPEQVVADVLGALLAASA
jgi:hypothetical protein